MMNLLQSTVDPESLMGGGVRTALGQGEFVPLLIAAGVGVVVGVILGILIRQAILRFSKNQNKPRWPRDWPRTRDLVTKDPNPTKPGYLPLSPRQAIGSGAMPLGRTYPRLRLIPDVFPLRGLRRWVEYATSTPVWVPYQKRFQHFAVLGKTGGGKSTSFAVPVLAYGAFEGNTAYFAIDVKSPAFARMFTHIYKQAGKDVVFFDPWSLDETLGFEPLWRASGERKDIIADVIATYSTDATQQQSSENSEFFRVAAIRLLRGLLDLAQFWPRKYCNLPCIQQMVGSGGNVLKEGFEKSADLFPTLDETLAAVEAVLPATAEELRAGDRPDVLEGALAVLDRSGYRIAFLIKRMRRYHFEHESGRYSPEQMKQAEKAFWAEVKQAWAERREQLDSLIMNQGEFINAPEDTRNSVVSTLTNKVNWFRDSNIAKAFSRDELDIRTLVERPCLFLVGAPMAKLKVGSLFVASILSNLAINAVFQRGMALERKTKGVSKHGIFFLLDEFPQLNIKSAPQVLATFRGFKSGLAMVYQERAQMSMLYGDDVQTMEGNTVHKVLLQGAQEETAEFYATKTIGEVQVTKRNKSGVAGEKKNISESTETMPLMTTQDVRFGRLNGKPMPNLAFSVGSDVPAFPLRPIPFYEDPTMRKMLGLERNLQKEGYDGRPTWKFWKWSERWDQSEESPPYLQRTKRRTPAERAAGEPDPVHERRQDDYTQYLDYLLGDYKGFDELVEPVLVLEDIGVTDNVPRSALKPDGSRAGGGRPQAAGNQGGRRAAMPASSVVPAYGTDFRRLINHDFRKEPAAIEDQEPLGGSLIDRIDAVEDES